MKSIKNFTGFKSGRYPLVNLRSFSCTGTLKSDPVMATGAGALALLMSPVGQAYISVIFVVYTAGLALCLVGIEYTTLVGIGYTLPLEGLDPAAGLSPEQFVQLEGLVNSLDHLQVSLVNQIRNSSSLLEEGSEIFRLVDGLFIYNTISPIVDSTRVLIPLIENILNIFRDVNVQTFLANDHRLFDLVDDLRCHRDDLLRLTSDLAEILGDLRAQRLWDIWF